MPTKSKPRFITQGELQGKPKIIAIVGSTASGKTALSLLLGAKFNGEVISADSRQIYRGLDIGTAKATLTEQAKAKHWLIDVKNPDEEYSVSEFKRAAEAAINDIAGRKQLPIVVGGTAQYLYALIDNWQIPKVKENKVLRAQLEKNIAEQGLEKVYEQLLELDPEAAYIVDPKNPRRVVRALEVALATGQPFSKQRQRGEPLFDSLILGVKLAPAELTKRIAQRVHAMIKAGLVEETKKLLKKYPVDLKVFDTIGYRELVPYRQGQITLAQAIAEIISHTKNFAKRQLTWFKRDARIKWIRNVTEAEALVEAFLQ